MQPAWSLTLGRLFMIKIEITQKNKVFVVPVEKINKQLWIHFKGNIFVLSSDPSQPSPPGGAKVQETSKTADILSPLPGRIVKVCVREGQKVKKNTSLLILTAMKMEYTLKAPAPGRVRLVKVKAGDQAELKQELMVIDPI